MGEHSKNAINLVKLCVGAEKVEDLEAWQVARAGTRPDYEPRHVTRMWPKRAAELVAGGSLYWVFKGEILARQPILRLEEAIGADGIRRCAIVMAPEIIRTHAAPRRPFQGWRYLAAEDAPRDLPANASHNASLPEKLSRALSEIGVL